MNQNTGGKFRTHKDNNIKQREIQWQKQITENK